MSIIRTRAGLAVCALPIAFAVTALIPYTAMAQVPGTTTIVGVPSNSSNGAGPGDIFAGADVDSYSPLETASLGAGRTGFNINDLFGSTTSTTLEPGNVVFSDTAQPDNIESVVFNTAAPVVLSSFTLGLNESGSYRSTDGFKLYGLSDASGTTSVLLSSVAIATPYSGTYGSDFISAGTVFTAPVTFQYYRLDVNYFDNGTGQFNGTRLTELQGFGTALAATPEPSAFVGLAMGTLGLSALALRARRRTA